MGAAPRDAGRLVRSVPRGRDGDRRGDLARGDAAGAHVRGEPPGLGDRGGGRAPPPGPRPSRGRPPRRRGAVGGVGAPRAPPRAVRGRRGARGGRGRPRARAADVALQGAALRAGEDRPLDGPRPARPGGPGARPRPPLRAGAVAPLPGPPRPPGGAVRRRPPRRRARPRGVDAPRPRARRVPLRRVSDGPHAPPRRRARPRARGDDGRPERGSAARRGRGRDRPRAAGVPPCDDGVVARDRPPRLGPPPRRGDPAPDGRGPRDSARAHGARRLPVRSPRRRARRRGSSRPPTSPRRTSSPSGPRTGCASRCAGARRRRTSANGPSRSARSTRSTPCGPPTGRSPRRIT
jgi:hypothetical protein